MQIPRCQCKALDGQNRSIGQFSLVPAIVVRGAASWSQRKEKEREREETRVGCTDSDTAKGRMPWTSYSASPLHAHVPRIARTRCRDTHQPYSPMHAAAATFTQPLPNYHALPHPRLRKAVHSVCLSWALLHNADCIAPIRVLRGPSENFSLISIFCTARQQ